MEKEATTNNYYYKELCVTKILEILLNNICRYGGMERNKCEIKTWDLNSIS